MKRNDDFFLDHHTYHERQRARLMLTGVLFAVGFAAVLAMLLIAFRAV